jgi:hypothetical protein
MIISAEPGNYIAVFFKNREYLLVIGQVMHIFRPGRKVKAEKIIT